MSRPEQIAPPEVFYNDLEASKYTQSTRVQHIQAKMTFRALELLNLDPGKQQFVLDIGCGSGLSGEILTEEGHIWVGMDISPSMLSLGIDRELEGDLLLGDMGNGLPFQPGVFDAGISISAIQWLCNADTKDAKPEKRLNRFFQTLYSCLKKGGKFVAQFYPYNDEQIEKIIASAKQSGFNCGLVTDNPESKKNKKHYLVLSSGSLDRPLNFSNMEVENTNQGKVKSGKLNRKNETKKEYIARKKETMQRRGKKVAKDSKFTGRQRKARF